MNFLLKKLGVIIPLVSFSLFSNHYAIAGEQEKKIEKYEFSSFGQIYKDDKTHWLINEKWRDIDGDGDLDVVLKLKERSDGQDNKIIIYENKVPQKKK